MNTETRPQVLIDAWAESHKLRVEIANLYTEGCGLLKESDALIIEGKNTAVCFRLQSEGLKLIAESDKLLAESGLVWLNALIAFYGNIEIVENNSYRCVLGNGDVYTNG